MEEIKAERPADVELTEAVVRGDSDAMAALRLKADPYSAAYTVGIVSVRPKQAIVADIGRDRILAEILTLEWLSEMAAPSQSEFLHYQSTN